MKKILIILIIFLLFGCTSGVSIEEFEEIQNNYLSLQEEYKKLESLNGDIQTLIDSKSGLENEIKELESIKGEDQEKLKMLDNYEVEIASLETKQNELNFSVNELEKKESNLISSVEELEKKSKSLQAKVDHLGELVLASEGEPFYVSPGDFYFGTEKDIKPGRYLVTPRKDGDFIVYDNSYRKIIDISIGTRSYYIDSYTFNAEEGYSLHNEGGIYLTLIIGE